MTIDWISGHQKWFPWHFSWQEMVSIGFLVTRNGFNGISGDQKWCQLDFLSPEMQWKPFLVTRNSFHGISGGQKLFQLDFWWPEMVSISGWSPEMVSLASPVARNGANWMSEMVSIAFFRWPEMASIGFLVTTTSSLQKTHKYSMWNGNSFCIPLCPATDAAGHPRQCRKCSMWNGTKLSIPLCPATDAAGNPRQGKSFP